MQSVGNFEEPESASVRMSSFTPATNNEVHNIIAKSPTKLCKLDAIPTSLMKKCSHAIVPVLTSIINKSMETGVVPEILKVANVRPLIKKKSLDSNDCNSYRPVSNLSFISKTLERVVWSRIRSFLDMNHLNDDYQSAYRSAHSTETALMRVQNDLLQAMDGGNISMLLLLDMSAAFDTVNHDIFIQRMKNRIGINGAALDWFRSYLFGRSQVVCINNTTSNKVTLDTGLPQGSVLCPGCFSIYTLPLGEIIHHHGLGYHCYADDTQIYVSVKPNQTVVDAAIEKMESCIDEIRTWMTHNSLKLNDDKTHFMIIGAKQQVAKVNISSIRIGTSHIKPTENARNLGVVFDSRITMRDQITSISKAAFMSIRNIGRIRQHLTRHVTELITHAFVTSRLDYGNALLYSISQQQLSRLQRLQNIAARMVTLSRKRDHITPVLQNLHWLPVQQRIRYKIALIVFKVLKGHGPAYLAEYVNIYKSGRTGLRSSGLGLLTQRSSRTRWGERSFIVASAQVWNSLPMHIRSAQNLECFKRELKTFFFNAAYSR